MSWIYELSLILTCKILIQGNLGGTMRLGKRQTVFKTADSVLRQMYGNTDTIEERHRHRYEVGLVFPFRKYQYFK